MMKREDWKELAGIILTAFGLFSLYFSLEANFPVGLFSSSVAGACLVVGISAWIDARIEKRLKKVRK